MSDELARLRADLEVLERYWDEGRLNDEHVVPNLKDKIARLEAEQADPWREHRASVEFMRKTVYAAADVPKVVAYIDHLTAERDRLAARVVELEAEIKAEDDADIADAEKALAEMVQANQDMGLYDAVGNPMVDDGDIPASWPPGKPDEPMLDPARVLATAAEAIDIAGFMLEKNTKHNVKVVLRDASTHQKPYRLKGASE